MSSFLFSVLVRDICLIDIPEVLNPGSEFQRQQIWIPGEFYAKSNFTVMHSVYKVHGMATVMLDYPYCRILLQVLVISY